MASDQSSSVSELVESSVSEIVGSEVTEHTEESTTSSSSKKSDVFPPVGTPILKRSSTLRTPVRNISAQLAADPSSLRLHKVRFDELWTPQLTNSGISSSLVRLDLSRVHVRTIPTQLGQLTALESLSITGNKLATFGSELAPLMRLKGLYLTDNLLKELNCDVLSRFDHLEALHLSNNKLKDIPPTLAGLTQLKELALRNNRLRALDPSITNLQALEYLSLLGNESMVYPPYAMVGDIANAKEAVFSYVEENPDVSHVLKRAGRVDPVKLGEWEWHHRNLLRAYVMEYQTEAKKMRSKLKAYLAENAAMPQQTLAYKYRYFYGTSGAAESLDDLPLARNPKPPKTPKKKLKKESHIADSEPSSGGKNGSPTTSQDEVPVAVPMTRKERMAARVAAAEAERNSSSNVKGKKKGKKKG